MTTSQKVMLTGLVLGIIIVIILSADLYSDPAIKRKILKQAARK